MSVGKMFGAGLDANGQTFRNEREKGCCFAATYKRNERAREGEREGEREKEG